ncbi:MAG: hypothetical protein R3F29_13175 [Planctomycetota bacterium]
MTRPPSSRRVLPLFAAALLQVGCESPDRAAGAAGNFDFARPLASFALPEELAEISGLATVDERTVACVEDETGTVFLLDVTTGAVTTRLPFGKDGDYEGLARLGDAYWVLRSDGRLDELRPDGDRLRRSRRLELDLPHDELEGLDASADGRQLLIAPKSEPRKKRDRDARRVYRLDPSVDEPQPTVLFETTAAAVAAQLLRLGADAEPDVRLSSIAEQPGTGLYYTLSGADRTLLVFTADGAVCGAHRFAKKDLPQPEALTFLPSGELVVSSEGGKGSARLVVYRPVGG